MKMTLKRTLKGKLKSCAMRSVSMLFRKETQRSEGPQQKNKKKKEKKMVSSHRLRDGVREAGQTPNQKA